MTGRIATPRDQDPAMPPKPDAMREPSHPHPLPAALCVSRLSELASDARHLVTLADLAIRDGQSREDRDALLWVMRDLADVLRWNLERFERAPQPGAEGDARQDRQPPVIVRHC